MSLKECYRCKAYGHVARDCPGASHEQPQGKRKDAGLRCFKCNQTGHLLRDCPEASAKSQGGFQQKQTLNHQQQHQYQQIQQQQQQQQLQFKQQHGFKINQQSAPAPKIITFFNANPNSKVNAPIVLKTGDNVQFLVNANVPLTSSLGPNAPSSSASSSASSPSSTCNSDVANSGKSKSAKSNQGSKQHTYQILVPQNSQQSNHSSNTNSNIVSVAI